MEDNVEQSVIQFLLSDIKGCKDQIINVKLMEQEYKAMSGDIESINETIKWINANKNILEKVCNNYVSDQHAYKIYILIAAVLSAVISHYSF